MSVFNVPPTIKITSKFNVQEKKWKDNAACCRCHDMKYCVIGIVSYNIVL